MKQGVSSLPWVIVTELVTESGKVVGALGFDFRKGKTIAFLSKAIILANGGGGAFYWRHDNPVRATGDGYALAFHAGCPLRDMEFVQFIPMGLAEPGKPAYLIAPPLADMGRVINSIRGGYSAEISDHRETGGGPFKGFVFPGRLQRGNGRKGGVYRPEVAIGEGLASE